VQFRFADCELDLDARTLLRSGRPVRMQALTFDLLALLLRHRGRVVSDAFLREQLWPDVAVGDTSLRQVLKEARRAIGDDGRAQAAIETLRGRGVRFVAKVETSGAPEAAFVGRGELIAALERALDEAGSGAGCVALLSGSPGIGKTAVLAELVGRAEVRGLHTLQGWGRAGSESDAYSLWTEVAERLLVPISSPASGEVPASGGISESQRFARFREFQRKLSAAAQERPLLVALDDLQFADRESLALLRFLAPTLRTARVCIVGTMRPLAAGDEHTRALAALAAEGATRVFELRGLDADELRALVRARLGDLLTEEAAAGLAARTGGSPLLALEVVRTLATNVAPAEPLSAARIEASVLLGLVPLVRRRLGVLDEITRRVLHAAAAVGQPLDLEVACAAAECTRAELAQALQAATRAGLVELASDGGWRFAHPLFAEAVVEDLESRGEAASSALHLRAMKKIEARAARDPFRLASHALRAASALPPAVLADHLRGAARAAWQVHAVADAESWQERAVEVAERAQLPPLELCDLLLELGELCVASSGVLNARVPFERAARIARDLGDSRRLARAALGFAHRALALDALEPMLTWLRTALAAPSHDAGLDARVAARLGAELSMGSERAEGERLLAEGVRRARQLGDALTLARVLADQSIVYFTPANPDGALTLAREVASCGRHAGDVEIEFRGLAEITTVQLERGDRSGFDEAFRDCEAFVARTPIPYAAGMTHGAAAQRALLDGRLEDARASMAAASVHARPTGDLGFGVVAGLQRFLLARETGELAPLLPVLDQARTHLPRLPGLAALAGLAHGLCGNPEPARAAAAALLAQLDELPVNRTRMATLAVGAELAHHARSAPLASALAPLLAPFAQSHAVAGIAATYWGSIEHALGFVALAQGRAAEAARHFERALRAHDALQAPAWSARSAEMLAAARGARGGVRLVS
jgi:DNA-binding winged helix-turn-helix (wHTH) protein/tetratricopeptide (TPR) repeat protein